MRATKDGRVVIWLRDKDDLLGALELAACKLDDMAERGEYWSDEKDTPESRTYPTDCARRVRELTESIARSPEAP